MNYSNFILMALTATAAITSHTQTPSCRTLLCPCSAFALVPLSFPGRLCMSCAFLPHSNLQRAQMGALRPLQAGSRVILDRSLDDLNVKRGKTVRCGMNGTVVKPGTAVSSFLNPSALPSTHAL